MSPIFSKVDNTIPPEESESGGSDELVDLNGTKIPVKFKRLKNRQPSESWTLLVYGNSKTGKTFFAGTAGAPTLFINIGDGLDTLRSPAFTSKYPDAENMIVVDIREHNPDTRDAAFDIVCDVVNHALSVPESKREFDTIVMDEATALRKYALNRAMDMISAQRTKARLGSRSEEYVKADVQDFNVEMDMIEWFLGQYTPKFKGAGINFLMLAHERQIFKKPEKIGDEPTLARIMPAFTGKTFPDKVPAYFDDVMRTEAVSDAASNTTYRIRTAGNDTFLSGTRHGGIFNVIESNPNYREMLNRIKNAIPKPSTSTNIKK